MIAFSVSPHCHWAAGRDLLHQREIFIELIKRRVPLGREQTLEDIAQLAAFLASDAARNITGQWISVDGGITLRQAH